MVGSRSLIMLGAELSSPEQSVRPHLPLRTGATFRFCRCTYYWNHDLIVDWLNFLKLAAADEDELAFI